MLDGLFLVLVPLAIPLSLHCLRPAWCYFNQEEVGSALAASLKEKHIKREDLFVTTKVIHHFHSPLIATDS